MSNEIQILKPSEVTKTVATAEVEARASGEVQAKYIVAYKRPRQIDAVLSDVHTKCQRVAFAKDSQYTFPRGGQTVNGPSIRLAEAVAQSYGNIDFGWKEVGQIPNGVEIEVWCTDLESNISRSLRKAIRYERQRKNGVIDRLTDPRDQYEHVANFAARYMRSCIQSVIPRDIFDQAMDICDSTLEKASEQEGKLSERIAKCVESFKTVNVTVDMIEARIGHKVERINQTELLSLGKIYNVLKDGMASVDQYFYQDKSGGDATQQTSPVGLKKKENTNKKIPEKKEELEPAPVTSSEPTDFTGATKDEILI